MPCECLNSARSFFLPKKLCLVRFTPPGPGGCHHRLECILNNDPGSTQQVDLFGQGAWPAIEATCGGWNEAAAAAWGGDDGSRSSSSATIAQDERSVVYMRPTCVGIVSSGVIKVRACCNGTGAAIQVRHAVRRDRSREGKHTRTTLVSSPTLLRNVGFSDKNSGSTLSASPGKQCDTEK